MHPDMCENHFQNKNPVRICQFQPSVQSAGLRLCVLVSVTLLGSRAAGTCASLTAKLGSTPPSFSPFVIWTGRLAGPRRLAFTPIRAVRRRAPRGKQARVSVRTSAEPLHQSHRCSSWHLGRLRWGGTGGLCGVSGAAEGQTEPQSLLEGFLCGTQNIVCAGKGHEDGNTAQS